MSKLIWNDSGNRHYKAGVDRGVLYPHRGEPATVWNGLTSVVEAPSDVIINSTAVDGVKIHRSTPGSFSATINALTYPETLLEYDGLGNLHGYDGRRFEFDFSYRTLVGNDVEGLDLGYRIHLVYNALATPSQPTYGTIGAGVDTSEFSWAISTRPVAVPGHRASAHLVIDSSIAYPEALSEFESVLYGSSTAWARMPQPLEIYEMFQSHARLVVTDHGDGTWTATGPDDAVIWTDSTSFEITWPSAIWVDNESYTLSTF